MITMFIGLMSTGMEEALRKSELIVRTDKKIRKLRKKRHIKTSEVAKLKLAFDFLDFFQRGIIGPIELYFALEHSGMPLDQDEFDLLWASAPKEAPTHIDFSEFLVIILDLRELIVIRKHERRSSKMNFQDSKSDNEVELTIFSDPPGELLLGDYTQPDSEETHKIISSYYFTDHSSKYSNSPFL